LFWNAARELEQPHVFRHSPEEAIAQFSVGQRRAALLDELRSTTGKRGCGRSIAACECALCGCEQHGRHSLPYAAECIETFERFVRALSCAIGITEREQRIR
jgi:hypothetical protein